MFVTLHIKALPENRLEVQESTPLLSQAIKAILEFDYDDAEYYTQQGYLAIRLNKEDQWVVEHSHQGGAGLVLNEQNMPVTCVATADSVTYHFRDTGYNGTFNGEPQPNG